MYQLVCFGVSDKREGAEERSVLKRGPLLFLWASGSTPSSLGLSQHPFQAINSQRRLLLRVWQVAKVLF